MAALRYFFSLFMIPVSFVLAGFAVVAFLAGYTDPSESEGFICFGMAMPVILLFNLLVLLYWLFVRKRWCFVPLAAIVLNISYLTAIFQVSFRTTETDSSHIPVKLASYNVGKFTSREGFNMQYALSEYMRNQEVSIVCFQEYRENPSIPADSMARLMHLPYYAIEYLPNSRTLGSIIFSKYPIIRSGKLPFQSVSNDAMWADLRIGPQTVRVISCHLQTTNYNQKRRQFEKNTWQDSSPELFPVRFADIKNTLVQNSVIRAAQARSVRKMTDTTRFPVLVCGDFNDPPSSYTYRHIKGALKDSFRSKGNGYAYTYRGIHKLLRIDYIFYSPPFECIEYRSPEKDWSDHNPVISKFMLIIQ